MVSLDGNHSSAFQRFQVDEINQNRHIVTQNLKIVCIDDREFNKLFEDNDIELSSIKINLELATPDERNKFVRAVGCILSKMRRHNIKKSNKDKINDIIDTIKLKFNKSIILNMNNELYVENCNDYSYGDYSYYGDIFALCYILYKIKNNSVLNFEFIHSELNTIFNIRRMKGFKKYDTILKDKSGKIISQGFIAEKDQSMWEDLKRIREITKITRSDIRYMCKCY